MFYIRYIIVQFLLDVGRSFVVKFEVMSLILFNLNNVDVYVVGVGVVSLVFIFSLLYQQIKVFIMQCFEVGEWKFGELIFSEVELGSCFKVSQGMVCKVIDELVVENLVVCCQGKGIFVVIYYEIQVQFCFLWLMVDSDELQCFENKIIEVKCVCVLVEVVCQLDMKLGDFVIFICCVKFFNGIFIIFEDIWLFGVIFKGLMVECFMEYCGFLYGLFEFEFGMCMICVEECICVVGVDLDVVEFLGVMF